MDLLDRQILAVLQQEGRLTITELAERVGPQRLPLPPPTARPRALGCDQRVVTRDLPDFQRVYDDRLATLPGVQRLSSTLVMKTVVENRTLPL